MTALNLIEAEYLLTTLCRQRPDLTHVSLGVRREITFAPGTYWYYLVEFRSSGQRQDHALTPRVIFAHAPHTENAGLAGAIWRACAHAADEALLLHATIAHYSLDVRAGTDGIPPCDHCDGATTVTRTQSVTEGRGKQRTTRSVEEIVACPVCHGTGVRHHTPFRGSDFETFRAEYLASLETPPCPR